MRNTLAVVLVGAVASATSAEDLTLSPSTSQEVMQVDAAADMIAGDPETDWNCLNVVVGGKSLRVIMPRYFQEGVLDSTSDVLELARLLVPETVLASTGDIATLYDDGTLHAVEYKVCSSDPNPVPGSPYSLTVTGTLLSDSGQTLGTMHCFNQGQYLARVAALGMTGENVVWCGPLGHGSTLGEKSVLVAGNDNSFHGSLKANGSFRVTGDDHTFEGAMLYGTDILVQVGSHTLGLQVQEAAAPLEGAPHTSAWYQANADHTIAGDVSILNDGLGGMVTSTGLAVSGLIHATGSISIEGNDIDAQATFVAGEGVEFIGNLCTFEPAVDELLAYSTGVRSGEGVHLPGSNLVLTGSLIAPSVRIGVSGSSNQIFGSVQAAALRIMGTSNSLSNVYQP